VKVSRSTLVIAMLVLVIVVLSWALVFYARDEFKLSTQDEAGAESIPAKSALRSKEGRAVIVLSAQSQQASGIETAALAAARNRGFFEVYGVVIDPRPLFELRARYLAALAESRAHRAVVAASLDEYQRLDRLYADEHNVSERVLLAAKHRLESEQARLAALEQAASALKESLRVEWGEKLASSAAEARSKTFDSLSARKEVLVRIALPESPSWDLSTTALKIRPAGVADTPAGARYLGPAPQSDPGLPGATHFFLAQGKQFRQGMRVAGLIDQEGQAREGVVVPHESVVWHGGKAWCYVQEEPEEFVRREVAAAEEMPGGWFNVQGFEPGEKVVVRGAQLLLSEEQKFQIREENED
jgi:hypothetical protein